MKRGENLANSMTAPAQLKRQLTFGANGLPHSFSNTFSSDYQMQVAAKTSDAPASDLGEFVEGRIYCQVTMKTRSGGIKSSTLEMDVPRALTSGTIQGSRSLTDKDLSQV